MSKFKSGDVVVRTKGNQKVTLHKYPIGFVCAVEDDEYHERFDGGDVQYLFRDVDWELNKPFKLENE